ncbi:MAG: nucleotidyltransferase [Candidatus Dadabacteria bacterium]|nr:nucleotidyltransferase [Candidatus Dadabacteria bacterium]MDE0663525.1 nucleotidyltransferase [Candidatus Dadabacteria bacterium]
MRIDEARYSNFLNEVAGDLDISPVKYKDAVERYQAVAKWLEGGDYPGSCDSGLDIYPQGSFRLGTVTRPIRNGIEADYDIDLVCEIPLLKEWAKPEYVKQLVGDRLKEHDRYKRMLDEEGKRCWTLIYSEEDNVGFHLDVLPSVPYPKGYLNTAIAITNKFLSLYRWSISDPKGYGLWFDGRNKPAFDLVYAEQKKFIQNRVPEIYAKIEDVPDQLVRTPLQRTIQIMKRHRDIKFNNAERVDYAPISIIITTLSAYFYRNESDVYSALKNIVASLSAHVALFEGRALEPTLESISPIKRTPDGKWYIGNPVNPEENFADRWHEDNHARAEAFFMWLRCLQEDLVDILGKDNRNEVQRTLTSALGSVPVLGNLEQIVPPREIESPPKIHISRPRKPWRN